jgi:hypothetical protein
MALDSYTQVCYTGCRKEVRKMKPHIYVYVCDDESECDHCGGSCDSNEGGDDGGGGDE